MGRTGSGSHRGELGPAVPEAVTSAPSLYGYPSPWEFNRFCSYRLLTRVRVFVLAAARRILTGTAGYYIWILRSAFQGPCGIVTKLWSHSAVCLPQFCCDVLGPVLSFLCRFPSRVSSPQTTATPPQEAETCLTHVFWNCCLLGGRVPRAQLGFSRP